MSQAVIFTVLQDILYMVITVGLAIWIGTVFYRVYKRERICTAGIFIPAENAVYRCMRIDPDEDMTAKKYALSVVMFSGVSIVFSVAVFMLQHLFFMNPVIIGGMSWHLAFNTAASFVSNTNWQSYSGESQLSYLSQMSVLTVQNFVSGAAGIAVLFALFRGFTRKQAQGVGNFWADLVKITLYIMIPMCFAGALVLISQGVPQTFNGAVSYDSLEGPSSSLFLGPGASQIIIKQLFTNGGGFWGVNSAHPFENPTPLSNLIQSVSLLLIPVALCFTFGKAVQDSKQGRAIFRAMTVIFIISLTVCTVSEFTGAVQVDGVAAAGNMEGKEVRFGVGGSALWATATTAVSNGSVNSMHDSFTPLGGLVPMFLMQLGEVVYGGVGCGLYGMLAFALLAVFIAGLMIGRTPEYLGKKIQPYDMKMVCLVILTPVLCVLAGTAATCFFPAAGLLQSDGGWLSNGGPHGFSEILYAYSSMGNNNGSAFAGFNANNPWVNVSGGIVMLLVRFIPMIAVVFLAGSLAKKKIVPESSGTLVTTNALFTGLLTAVVIIVGALSFFPALALGPLAEFFG